MFRFLVFCALFFSCSNIWAEYYVYNFTADWCGYCQQMKPAWVSPDVKAKLKKFHGKDKYDFDWDDENLHKYYDYYGVTSIPTVIIVDQNGKVIKRKQYMSRHELLKFLEVK